MPKTIQDLLDDGCLRCGDGLDAETAVICVVKITIHEPSGPEKWTRGEGQVACLQCAEILAGDLIAEAAPESGSFGVF